MNPVLGIASFVLVLGGVVYAIRRWTVYERARSRFMAPEREASATSVDRSEVSVVTSGPLSRRWWWVGWPIGALVAGALFLLMSWPLAIAVALGLVAALLVGEFENWLAARRRTLLETQLADAIDLMVGALGVGASVENALAAAVEETRRPLQGELDLMIARIRLGDSPQSVFRELAQRVPLETFLLFGTTLSIHWEVGGSLAPVLATVGRTVRDRMETTRRIASNIVQSQLSTLFILGLTYFIAAVVWRNTPDQMATFVRTEAGQTAVAVTMLLQAIGIVWMNKVSKPNF